jgi:hypothetical protein
VSFPGIDSISEPHPYYEPLLRRFFNNIDDIDRINAIMAIKAKRSKASAQLS